MTYQSIIAQMGEAISFLGQLVSDLSDYNDNAKGVPVVSIGRDEGTSKIWIDFRDKGEVELALTGLCEAFIAQLQNVLGREYDQLSILTNGKVSYQESLWEG